MWWILAFVLILFLSILLVRYHLTICSLTSQIRAKHHTGSQVRLTLRDQAPSLVALTDEVEQLFQEIDKMSFVTQQEKKTLDMAISNIAHDIRTPLTIASGYTQQLLKDADKNQMDQQLQKIADNLSMVSRRLEALMEYRRLMEGAIRPKLERVAGNGQ